MPFVQHPSFPDDVREVTQEELKDFTDSGWVRVKKDDEPKEPQK